MNILIIGASGFIGGHILKVAKSRGHKVALALRNFSKLECINVNQKIPLNKHEFITSLIKLNNEQNIDMVIHAAGVINVRKSESKSINAELTRLILEGLSRLDNHPRLVYISSVSAINSLGVYGLDKRKSEELIVNNYDNWTILRPALVYGAGDKKNIGTLIKIVKLFPIIPVFRESITLQPLHIDDLVHVILRLSPYLGKNRIYTLAGPQQQSFIYIVNAIISATKSSALIILISLKSFRRLIYVASKIIFFYRFPVQQISGLSDHAPWDISLARQELGFNPRAFDEGIVQVVDNFEQGDVDGQG